MNRNIRIETYENDTLLFKHNTTCIFEDNYLSYNTDNDSIRINLNDFNFTKENVESIMHLTKETCNLTIKELKQSLEIPLEYLNYKNDNNKIEIEYKLETLEYPLKIVIEIGEERNEI